MFFSAHVADTGPLAALTRRTPKTVDAPGLRSARIGIGAPFSPGPIPRPQLGREVMVACWDNENALDRFLTDHPVGQTCAEGWHVRMEMFRAVGVWPGLTDDMGAVANEVSTPETGPTVAITIGTAYLKSVSPFMKVTAGLEEQFLETPSTIWGTGFSNLPQRLVATLTIWESASAAVQYMRTGAHDAAVKAHYDPVKDPTGHTFVTGGGFFGLRPISTHGSVAGKNPPPIRLPLA